MTRSIIGGEVTFHNNKKVPQQNAFSSVEYIW